MDLRERQGREPANRHPWELSRARALERLLLSAGLPPRLSILDVGCGDGWLLSHLGRSLGKRHDLGRLVGVDPWLDHHTQGLLMWGTPAVHTERSIEEVAPGAFQVVLLLDVLEHVEDDLELLCQASALADPEGTVFITVPAHPDLFGAQDRSLHHLRRYRRSSLRALVKAAGLRVEAQGALFASLLFPRLASVVAERLLSVDIFGVSVGAWRYGPLATSLIRAALDLDNALLGTLSRVGLPTTGLSLWVRCRPVSQNR